LCTSGGCHFPHFFNCAPATSARALVSYPASNRADSPRGSSSLTASLPFAVLLAVGDFRARHLSSYNRGSWNLLRSPSSVACLAIRLAALQNYSRSAPHAGWHWSSRGSAGHASRAIRRPRTTSASDRNRCGRHHYCWRASRRLDGVPSPPSRVPLVAISQVRDYPREQENGTQYMERLSLWSDVYLCRG